jgi:hypothetical protein
MKQCFPPLLQFSSRFWPCVFAAFVGNFFMPMRSFWGRRGGGFLSSGTKARMNEQFGYPQEGLGLSKGDVWFASGAFFIFIFIFFATFH